MSPHPQLVTLLRNKNRGSQALAGTHDFLMAKSFKDPEQYAVLLADDSEADRALMRDALRNNPRFAVVGEACDGDEVISYLTRSQGFSNPQKPAHPDLLLLDLRMPCKNGYEVLEWLRSKSFKNMLVVVLAGSSLPEDYEKCIELGAHAYYVKIPQRQARIEMVSSLETLLDVAHEGTRCAIK